MKFPILVDGYEVYPDYICSVNHEVNPMKLYLVKASIVASNNKQGGIYQYLALAPSSNVAIAVAQANIQDRNRKYENWTASEATSQESQKHLKSTFQFNKQVNKGRFTLFFSIIELILLIASTIVIWENVFRKIFFK